MHTGNAKRLMIFIDETDRFHGANLGVAIVERLKKEGCAGATVLRGMSGFGVHGQVHTTAIVDLSVNLPVVIIAVDDIDVIDRVLPILQEMVSEGLILVDEVRAIRQNGRGKEPAGKAAEASATHHLVREYMDESPVTITAGRQVDEIIKLLIETHQSCLPVVNESNILLGIVSAQDLLSRIVNIPQGPFRLFSLRGSEKHQVRRDIRALTASQIMLTHFAAVEPGTPMAKAVQIMLHDHISALPVVQDHKLVGTLALPDLLQKALAVEVQDLPAL